MFISLLAETSKVSVLPVPCTPARSVEVVEFIAVAKYASFVKITADVISKVPP
jgi:hypothetical protein